MIGVLFVCTGNTCRSPLAAALFERAVRRTAPGLARATSAGVGALEGEPASPGARTVAGELGLDLESHRSRSVTPELVAAADLILTMERRHKERVLAMAPQAAGKVFTLAEYVGESADVEDPYQADLPRYREVAARLERLTEQALRRLAREAGRAAGVVAVGWDHGGAALKEAVLQAIRERGMVPLELSGEASANDDYPDPAQRVAQAVAEGRAELGVLMCGTGIGVSIAANKVPGIRAALCHDVFSARMARAHNDANVLTLGGRVVGPGLAADVVRAFLDGRFEGGRHGRRLDKIAAMERSYAGGSGEPGPAGPAAG